MIAAHQTPVTRNEGWGLADSRFLSAVRPVSWYNRTTLLVHVRTGEHNFASSTGLRNGAC